MVWDPDRASSGLEGGRSGEFRYRCILDSGFISNRSSLAARLGIEGVAEDGRLVEGLYEAFGSEAAALIAGPYSFVLWDRAERRLEVVSDRSGVSRLHYMHTPDGIAVSNSVTSLAVLTDEKPTLDLVSLVTYICGSPVPIERTFFASIRSVAPGHRLKVDARNVDSEAYWSLDPSQSSASANVESWTDELEAVLETVTSEYLGEGLHAIALSGGVDSPLVAVMLRRVSPGARLPAIRIVAPELGDTDRSAKIGEMLSLESHEVDARHLRLFPGDRLETVLSAPDVPLNAALHPLLLEKAAGLGLRRLFTGWGGDELFGGSISCYPDLLLTGRWADLGHQIRAHSGLTGESLSRIAVRDLLRPMAAFVGRELLGSPRAPVEPVPWLGRAYRDSPVADSISPPLMLPGRRQRCRRIGNTGSVRAVAPLLRAARQRGVEVCSPFADHRLREFAAGLPTSETFHAGHTKVILRRLLRRSLPEDLVSSLGKSLLGDRIARLLRTTEAPVVRDLISGMRAAEMGLVDETALRAHYEALVAGEHRDFTFWRTLTVEAWLRQHF